MLRVFVWDIAVKIQFQKTHLLNLTCNFPDDCSTVDSHLASHTGTVSSLICITSPHLPSLTSLSPPTVLARLSVSLVQSLNISWKIISDQILF